MIWKEKFVDKLAIKHRISLDEAEEVLFGTALFRRIKRGQIKGEDVYVAYGRTETGRYLVIFFIFKYGNAALPISARDMTRAERRYYHDQKTR